MPSRSEEEATRRLEEFTSALEDSTDAAKKSSREVARDTRGGFGGSGGSGGGGGSGSALAKVAATGIALTTVMQGLLQRFQAVDQGLGGLSERLASARTVLDQFSVHGNAKSDAFGRLRSLAASGVSIPQEAIDFHANLSVARAQSEAELNRRLDTSIANAQLNQAHDRAARIYGNGFGQ